MKLNTAGKFWIGYFAASIAVVLFSTNVNAYQIWTPLGVTDTHVPINPVSGKPQLNLQTIDMPNNGQTQRQFGFVFGRKNNLENVRCDVWEGPTCQYVFPSAPMQMRIVSTSASDAAAGTGVRTMEITFLDANYVQKTETITLNGTTPVNTVATDILRVNRTRSVTVGSGGSAAGTISLTNVAGSVTYDIIPATFVSSRKAIYTVPANKTGYIAHWQASSGAATGSHFTIISLRATAFSNIPNAPGIFASLDEVGTLNNSANISLPIPVRIPEKTDVKITAVSDAANAGVTVLGAVIGWFEDN